MNTETTQPTNYAEQVRTLRAITNRLAARAAGMSGYAALTMMDLERNVAGLERALCNPRFNGDLRLAWLILGGYTPAQVRQKYVRAAVAAISKQERRAA